MICRAASGEHGHSSLNRTMSRSTARSAQAEEVEDEDDQSLFDAEIRKIIGRGDAAGTESSP